MVDQPLPRAAQEQAAEQRRALVGLGRLLPVGERMVELHPADQEVALLVKPAAEPRPFAQERLVRHLDGALPALLAEDDEPRRLEPLQDRPRLLRDLVEAGGPARIFALAVDPDQPADEGLAQRLEILGRRVGLGQHLVGALPHGVLERVEAAGRIAERGVVDERELP